MYCICVFILALGFNFNLVTTYALQNFESLNISNCVRELNYLSIMHLYTSTYFSYARYMLAFYGYNLNSIALSKCCFRL
jgi:predicted membrane channel-forming protein YqfA (hemolysin III family)